MMLSYSSFSNSNNLRLLGGHVAVGEETLEVTVAAADNGDALRLFAMVNFQFCYADKCRGDFFDVALIKWGTAPA
jgi:hypothetical protein